MGILELLTVLFVALKLLGVVDWSWFWVLSPFIFAIGMYILLFIGFLVVGVKTAKATAQARVNRWRNK